MWLSEIEGTNPANVRAEIRAAVAALAGLGDVGRPSKVEGWPEYSVRKAPYVVAYRIRGGVLEILAVYHAAQRR